MTATPQVYDPLESGKDYVVKVKIQNGPLLRAMRRRGFNNVAAFARACGLTNPTTIHNYLALMLAPINRRGHWSRVALKMAEVLGVPPDCLFPEQHLETALKRSTGEIEMSADDIKGILAPEPHDIQHDMEIGQADATVNKLLSTVLTAREEHVIRRRFGFCGEVQTLEEVGGAMNLSRDRIRQIECKAIRKFKRPDIARKLATTGGYEFLERYGRTDR